MTKRRREPIRSEHRYAVELGDVTYDYENNRTVAEDDARALAATEKATRHKPVRVYSQRMVTRMNWPTRTHVRGWQKQGELIYHAWWNVRLGKVVTERL